MSPREDRLIELSRRAEREREELAGAISGLRRRIADKRARWRSLGFMAGALAAGVTSAYRLFARDSFSARLSRWSTAGSVALGLARLFFRLFR